MDEVGEAASGSHPSRGSGGPEVAIYREFVGKICSYAPFLYPTCKFLNKNLFCNVKICCFSRGNAAAVTSVMDRGVYQTTICWRGPLLAHSGPPGAGN